MYVCMYLFMNFFFFLIYVFVSLSLVPVHKSRNFDLLEATSKLQELQEWLNPTKKVPIFSHESLQPLILQLKIYADDILKLPRGLITVMRILNWLAVPPDCKYTHGKILPLFFLFFTFPR